MAVTSTAKEILKACTTDDEIYQKVVDELTSLDPDDLNDQERIANFFGLSRSAGLPFAGSQYFQILSGGVSQSGFGFIAFAKNDPFGFLTAKLAISVGIAGVYSSNGLLSAQLYVEFITNLNINSGYNFPIPSTDSTDPDFESIILYSFIKDLLPYSASALKVVKERTLERLAIWRAYGLDGEITDDEVEKIELEETIGAQEDSIIIDDPLQSGYIEDVVKLISKLRTEEYSTDTAIGVLTKYGFKDGSRSSDTNKGQARVASYLRTFQAINADFIKPESENGIADKYVKKLFEKIEESGILEVASYAYEISNFAKKRLANKYTIQQSAENFTDDGVDLPWLVALSESILKLKQDPLTLASIYYYIPSLATFLLDAIAIITDYSNNGRGGGSEDTLNNSRDFYDSLEKAFGINSTGEAVFKMAFDFINTADRIKAAMGSSPYRANVTPNNPDIFHLRLGAANFYVPPISIDVSTQFKIGSITGGAIRQKNSPKFNTGYKETHIRMQLIFPNYEEIWGIRISDASTINLSENYKIDFANGGDTEIKIDKFLSSLRGLVAAFKYSPILPVRNHYLNSVHGITAVALSNMTIKTMPSYPFAFIVELQLLNFNHQPFLPMIKDFNQAIHWGKYRQYMGKAAGHLHSYVNESFLIKSSDIKEKDNSGQEIFSSNPNTADDSADNPNTEVYKESQIIETNIIDEWIDGNHISLFVPAETQTKIFLPDSAASFRSEQEKITDDLGQNFWEGLLKRFGLDINQSVEFESAKYGYSYGQVLDLSRSNNYNKTTYAFIKGSLDLLVTGFNSSTAAEQTYKFLITSFLLENVSKNFEGNRVTWLKQYDPEYSDMLQYSDIGPYSWQGKELKFSNGELYNLRQVKELLTGISVNPKGFLDYLTDKKIFQIESRTGQTLNDDQRELNRQEIAKVFNVYLYDRFFKSGPIQSLMEAARARNGSFRFNEWEVPMIRVDLDPSSVIVNGISVSLGNNFGKMQVQMQDEPTYQHIGGTDSSIYIAMTITGEKELIKFKRIFDHISGLARLEHATGVLGFMGIKNIVTALCGIKYAMPMAYQVETIPNYPHVYKVELTLLDFDIFQQKREQLSSTQQKDLIQEFGAKRNPFLRIKQFWGSFNAYPDFPLYIKDETGATIGHLDPDFYFRSFEMFDKDVINNFSDQTPRVQDYTFSDESSLDLNDLSDLAAVYGRVYPLIRDYQSAVTPEEKKQVLQNLKNYILEIGISTSSFMTIFTNIMQAGSTELYPNDPIAERNTKLQFYTDYIQFSKETTENNPFLEEVNPAAFQVGEYSPNQGSQITLLDAALKGELNLPNEEFISFDPDEVDFHKQIFVIPAVAPGDIMEGKIPAILQTAIGNHFGYISRTNGRFYLTANGINVKKDSSVDGYKFKPNLVKDVQTPDTGNTTVNSRVPGVKAISEYQNAYDGDVYSHWEKMLVDTSYRDISGRMVRAFPTYMLWLIDEGGYFAGLKLFDNFYGLQSIIDFSVVSSEDLLGDTLIFRVSNMYSKLTTKESTKIFNPNLDSSNTDDLSLTEGMASIIDRTLNVARNIMSGMRNEYVIDINNIRLKPGVRVHLRAGYGSNPNSLQTIFNGVITNVEQGEIVTVTAQSDAIELGAVINSVNKKGDSGKIDGGINTGMWMSEPRDLMVRLLSMGASRTREAIARATVGTVFSENKFGIRHFGNMLYDPLTDQEKARMDGMLSAISGAMTLATNGKSLGNKITQGFLSGVRSNILPSIGQLFSNFCAQTDLEVYKRNIYPGNGTGMAQFLGGDLDDGWSTAASLVPRDSYNDRVEGYLGRLTDRTWNQVIADAEMGSEEARSAIDNQVEDNILVGDDNVNITKGAVAIASGAIASIVFGPVGGVVVGAGLLGVASGRGGTNFFRTMGLISMNEDDDLPGFDEVSFRAQTYMKTVWDIFQTCARLLPNYIVAVRPFEDRSTVFYGKPHWLYTSGVVPVTTGYPGDERAAELGIILPKIKDPDNDLAQILDNINKNSNPLIDYAAFYESFELAEGFSAVSDSISSSSGVYAATASLTGKLINFSSSAAMQYVNPSNLSEIKAKMPLTKGWVGLGLHLPIISKLPNAAGSNSQVLTEDLIQNQVQIHKQLSNLPPRYRFPFFIASEDLVLEKYSSFFHGQDDSSGGTADDSEIEDANGVLEKLYEDLKDIEDAFFEENKLTLSPSNSIVQYDTPLGLSQSLGTQAEETLYPTFKKVRMPIPNIQLTTNISGTINTGNVSPDQVDEDFSFEYDEPYYGKLLYTEWGAPETPQDEQFYIAMRWPYNPSTDDDGALAKFKEEYDFENLYGTAKDYLSRKVLIFNANNGRAVVCRPAYFMWGEDRDTDAVVSPDAAYFLGVITDVTNDDAGKSSSGFRNKPKNQECYMAFVPDNIPVGAVAPQIAPASAFKLRKDDGTTYSEEEARVIGFGAFKPSEGSDLLAQQSSTSSVGGGTADTIERRLAKLANSSIDGVTPYNAKLTSTVAGLPYGGNVLSVNSDGKSYFETIINGTAEDLDDLDRDSLYDILNDELVTTGSQQTTNNDGEIVFVGSSASGRVSFAPVYSELDDTSIKARAFYDEKFDPSISAIAGNGRTLRQAEDIWDQFRFGYHTYESVKQIFFEVYHLDPNDDLPWPEFYNQLLDPKADIDVFAKFNSEGTSALDEFAILLGEEYMNGLPTTATTGSTTKSSMEEAIEYARANFIDAPAKDGGLVDYFNTVIKRSFNSIRNNFLFGDNINNVLSFSIGAGTSDPNTVQQKIIENIKTPKQLFLLMVGIFRQRMWEDPYARAWLVLKPDRKKTGKGAEGQWSFKPVDKIFRAFIDPYSDYGNPTKKDKFIKLLVATKGEGNSSTNIVSDTVNNITDFFGSTLGPIWSAISDGLTGLLSVIKLNMQQMGYAIDESIDFRKQSHILNKVLNDSIYYSLGRPGTILRAVDNPFTREYAEPVIEIREPFQRMHYISSFSHIISNKIQENINGVATVVTAISDGKYPVTVALDKGSPAERQVEKTVETGIYYDNVVGSGFTGFLHPIMHPLQTARGIAKNVQGTPDELSARRIALAHLKESIKDIYGGELILMGNTDIRPFDLVYLADVYERMYGIFEVEQVVHHFTPELGFITSITPNALVTVNDPARWFLTSWVHSWMNVQTIRNDTRIYLDRMRAGNSGISIGGNISMQELAEKLQPQITGGYQFTHGSSAIVKDVMALEMAKSLPDARQQLAELAGSSVGGGNAAIFAAMSSIVIGGAAGVAGAVLAPVTGGASLLVGGTIGGVAATLAWKGWEWMRDNVLDQHGCYVQYLNKNGQPMDAGLAYNQGMVVGQHHSTNLLPGILGIRVKTRTPDGNSFVRTDDLFKSMGWTESQITDLTRYTSYEDALTHARVLKLAGLGADKAGLEPQFKVIVKAEDVISGDTIKVKDVISGISFQIRLNGIRTADLNAMQSTMNFSNSASNTDLELIDLSSPSGQAKVFSGKALKNKLFVIRINETRSGSTARIPESDYEAGSVTNTVNNYQKDKSDQILGTVFYYDPLENIEKIKALVGTKFRDNINNLSSIKDIFKDSFDSKSVFAIKFNEILTECQSLSIDYFDITDQSDVLFSITDSQKQLYSNIIHVKIIEDIYELASAWPIRSWDEYYPDGHPLSLNWELVVNNLARVDVAAIQQESESVQTAIETAPIPRQVA